MAEGKGVYNAIMGTIPEKCMADDLPCDRLTGFMVSAGRLEAWKEPEDSSRVRTMQNDIVAITAACEAGVTVEYNGCFSVTRRCGQTMINGCILGGEQTE